MTRSKDDDSLGQLQTEARSSSAQNIDSLDTLALCKAFHHEEAQVTYSVACCLFTIASLINDLVPRLRDGGRLIYVGAGNSGRVGFMDCSELPPTFSADPKQFLTVVAGGISAIIQAQEGAEDFETDGVNQLEALKLTAKDTVIGISASGRTPFVLGALKVALKCNALTAGICNTYRSNISQLGVEYSISALVGPEFLAGSTRLKAGSSAKQILNMISTCSMVKLGKTYKNLMIDVQVKNKKLKARGRRIVRQVCEGASMHILGENSLPMPQPVDIRETAEENSALDFHIELCGGSVKLASAVAVSGLALDAAQKRLDLVDGNFHRFIKWRTALMELSIKELDLAAATEKIPDGGPDPYRMIQVHDYLNVSFLRMDPSVRAASKAAIQTFAMAYPELYFLSVDGGGTNCTISIATRSKIIARAMVGACNFNCVSLEELLYQIKSATVQAVANMPKEHRRLFTGMPKFTRVWAGIAGLYQTGNLETLTHRLEELFGVSLENGSFRLTSDGTLLSSCIGLDDSVEGGISVIAGTGSVGTAFKKSSNGEVVQVGRTGGWGHLIGDQGSAFDIGKRALQTVLASLEQSQSDRSRQLTDLEAGVLAKFNCNKGELLSNILHSRIQPTLLIGDLAKVVTELGFRDENPDSQALAILKSTASCLVQLIKPLAKTPICDPSKSSLILSGALMNLSAYRNLILEEWAREQLVPFQKVMVINDISGYAAQFLAKQTTALDRL
ncbi:hypothetical protein V502_00720 [Pseudogymnoascus sp. VKM F-4520 (FW-2644)]|nr:hypothetical protein V502_00720 [Pseudogymnoascus sp. VKM F-4520 (FW-2644)]